MRSERSMLPTTCSILKSWFVGRRPPQPPPAKGGLGGVVFLLFVIAPSAFGQAEPGEVPPRFGVTAIPRNYPQSTPKEAVTSMIRALDRKRYDYLAAHLMDPAFVNAQVNENGMEFAEIVAAVKRSIEEDPESVKQLRKLARDGDIDAQPNAATVTHASVADRKIYLQLIDQRWFIENRYADEKKPE